MSFLSHVLVSTLPRPPRVRHKSFTAQPLDLLSWRYVYLLGFDLLSNLTRHLASYPVSVRRLNGFATPLPPPKHYCLRLVVRYTWRYIPVTGLLPARTVPCPAHYCKGSGCTFCNPLPFYSVYTRQFVLVIHFSPATVCCCPC